MKNLLTIFLLIIVQFAFGQSGSIQGTVVGEAIMFAEVSIFKNEQIIAKRLTDFDGNYSIHNLEAGIYEVAISYVGYNRWNIVEVNLSEYQTQFVNTTLSYNNCCFCEVRIKQQQVNINPWNFTQNTTFSADEIQRNPIKN